MLEFELICWACILDRNHWVIPSPARSRLSTLQGTTFNIEEHHSTPTRQGQTLTLFWTIEQQLIHYNVMQQYLKKKKKKGRKSKNDKPNCYKKKKFNSCAFTL